MLTAQSHTASIVRGFSPLAPPYIFKYLGYKSTRTQNSIRSILRFRQIIHSVKMTSLNKSNRLHG